MPGAKCQGLKFDITVAPKSRSNEQRVVYGDGKMLPPREATGRVCRWSSWCNRLITSTCPLCNSVDLTGSGLESRVLFAVNR